MQKINPLDFFPLNVFEKTYPVQVDLVYANEQHPNNHFVGLYNSHAKLMWVHKQILPVILLASLICKDRYGWTLKVNDVFRPVEAQAKMTIISEGSYPEELVSRPGNGAHPRGMAFDVEPLDETGARIDMGTPYDYFAQDLKNNPAAREGVSFPGKSAEEAKAIIERRKNLEQAVTNAARQLGHEILPLADEWWDFRFKDGRGPHMLSSAYWADYAPVYEKDLPTYMWLVAKPEPVPDAVQKRWEGYAQLAGQAVRERARIGHSREHHSIGSNAVRSSCS